MLPTPVRAPVVAIVIGLAACGTTGAPYTSMSTLPIGSRWRTVAEWRMTARNGGCESGNLCIAYGVIAPTGPGSVEAAEADLVGRLLEDRWHCIAPHPGGSIALVSDDRRTWVEMQPVPDVDQRPSAPRVPLVAAAALVSPGTTGLAVWLGAATRPAYTDPALPASRGTCPTAASR